MLPLRLNLLLPVGKLPPRLVQITHDLSHTLLIGSPHLPEGRVGLASLIAQADAHALYGQTCPMCFPD